MTSTKIAKTTADEIWAKLDAMDAAPAPAAQAPEPVPPVVVKDQPRKGGKASQLALEALAGITSGRPRRELHRPKYGQQTELAVPVNSQGRLDATSDLVAGRSRRYAQDLEGWCRAALADHAQRGVLVIWDGMFYTITLDPAVQPRTVVEVHRRDLAAWRAKQ